MKTTTRNGLKKSESTDTYLSTRVGNNDNFDIIDAAISKCNFAGGALAPTANDDEADGYSAGSLWFSNSAVWICHNATEGAAVWKQMWPALSNELSGTISNAQLAGSISNDKLAGSISNDKLAGSISDDKLATSYIKADGTRELSANWDVGSHAVRAETFQSDVATGTAPLTIASTTKVTNLHADILDGAELSTDVVADPGVDTKIPSEKAIRTTLTNLVATLGLDGWLPAGETWTYAGADSPSFTFTISEDKSTKYYPGMRIKLTQSSTVKYFIVTKVSYSSPNTTITVYGGTDYSLANEAISSPYYSMVKAPTGFPLDNTKWTVTVSDSSARTQSNPTGNTWYNVGSTYCQISVPIGMWKLEYKAIVQINGATVSDIFCTLSTANNTESNPMTTNKVYFVSGSSYGFGAHGNDIFVLTAKTTLYLNAKTSGTITSGSIAYMGDQSSTTIQAICAYL